MRDKTIKVAVAIDVRGKNNRRCGVGCWAKYTAVAYGMSTVVCDAYAKNGSPTVLRESKLHPGEYLRCKACRDAEKEVK